MNIALSLFIYNLKLDIPVLPRPLNHSKSETFIYHAIEDRFVLWYYISTLFASNIKL
jgi:hypothetical protein